MVETKIVKQAVLDRSTAFWLFSILAIGVLLMGLRLIKPEWASAVWVERLQLVAFPLFLVALWRIRFGRFRIHRVALLIAAISGVAATSYGYLYIAQGSTNVVLMARLKRDSDEGVSSRFRERLEYFINLGMVTTTPRRYYREFDSDHEVRAMFNSTDHIEAVVWGKSRFLHVSFPDRAPIELATFGNLHLSPTVTKLSIVDSVPVTGLSYEPRESAAFFISRLFEGMIPSISPRDAHFESTREQRYAALHFGAEVAVLHFSAGHRSFALWRSGTDSLFAYLVGGAKERSLLTCAARDFKTAKKLLRRGENPELSAALYNNRGVVAALQADVDGGVEKLMIARRLFKKATKTRKEREPFGLTMKAYQTALRNSAVINGEAPDGPKKSHRKSSAKRKVKNDRPKTH